MDLRDVTKIARIDKVCQSEELLFHGLMNLEQYMLSEKRSVLLEALRACSYNQSRVAAMFGVSYRQARYHLRTVGYEVSRVQSEAFLDKKEALYRSAFSKLRYDIFVKYGGRCLCCGRSAKDGIKLHVDHVKPRKTHPELELDPNNLQLLCEPCNLSKSARDMTDWR